MRKPFHLSDKVIYRIEPTGTCSKCALGEHERRVMFP